MLKRRAEELFIKKECDRQAPNVIASVITAASKMAIPAGIVSEEDTLKVLIEAYNIGDRKEVLHLLGLSPAYVKNAIGYSPDFNDAGHAAVVYAADKDSYDSFYTAVKVRVQEEEEMLEEAGPHM